MSLRKQGERTPEGENRRLEAVTQHGHACNDKQTSEYRAWADMLNRCQNSNIPNYHLYGGRGIKVCKRWYEFSNFLDDMGDKPSSNHSLGRIDNDGDYTPENCRWETREQQNNNRSDNKFIECDGLKLTPSQWARRLGISRDTIWARIRRGWSDYQVIKGISPSGRKLPNRKPKQS